MMNKKSITVAFTAVACLLAGAGTLWHIVSSQHKSGAPKIVYDPHGYGGFVAVNEAPKAAVKTNPIAIAVSSAREAYNEGNYSMSEKVATSVVTALRGSRALESRTAVADARQVLAYAAARQHNLKLARMQFSLLQQTATTLPAGGIQSAPFGEEEPSLEQEAVFEHAVCTAALGNPAAAEIEYRQFMKKFPGSPLLHAASDRIARMHGGDLPIVDLAVWKKAQATALADQKAEATNEAMCGPDCVAELLRRHGLQQSAKALAQTMGTSGQGSSLASLAKVLNQHGLTTRGLKLDEVGLLQQKLPLIALVAPGHYVIVDRIANNSVVLWDPDANGVNSGGDKTLTMTDWQRSWQGIALTVSDTTTHKQTLIATSVVKPSNGRE